MNLLTSIIITYFYILHFYAKLIPKTEKNALYLKASQFLSKILNAYLDDLMVQIAFECHKPCFCLQFRSANCDFGCLCIFGVAASCRLPVVVGCMLAVLHFGWFAYRVRSSSTMAVESFFGPDKYLAIV